VSRYPSRPSRSRCSHPQTRSSPSHGKPHAQHPRARHPLPTSALTTTVGINGPPLVIWLRARHATLTQLRDTLAIIFLTLNLAAIPSVAAHGGTIPGELLPALAGGLIIGHVVGLQAHQHLPAPALDRALVAILSAAATASIVAGATALL
jgi:H+/Cl- antiporter ClcA